MSKHWFITDRVKRWLILLKVVFVLCTVRIIELNQASWLDKYSAHVVTCSAGSYVEMPSEYYYFSGYEALRGYYMQVTKTELIPTRTLLSEYDMTLSELEEMSTFGRDTDLSDYEYIYIITAKFGNRDYENNAEYHIEFDDFLLVGPDYCISANTDGINAIPAFNEELNGATGFGISSDREMTFRIAYLIDTRSESALSIDYLLLSSPKLLVGYYPDEVYIELPTPEILE